MRRTPFLPRSAVAAPLALLVVLVTVRGQDPLRTPADRPVDIKHIRLDLRVDLPKKTVDAVATLSLEALRPLKALSLDAVEFEVKKVTLADDNGGSPIPFTHDGKHLDLDINWPAHQDPVVRIEYKVRDPRAGLYFFQPSPAEPDVPSILWSQGETTDNRYWIPCLDNPNQKQSTEMFVTAPDGYEVLGNGRLAEKTPNGDGTAVWHWAQRQPHASYLITLVVGKFDVVREDWRGKEVSFYVPVGHKADIGRSFGRTRDMLDFFSRRFGIDYPWDKYTQVVVEQFTAGGMENTTATTLNDYALLDERALLDGDVDNLISHELGHQWWGDLVTCKDWAHIWLNEGFASYCEILWEEHRRGADDAALDLLGKLHSAAVDERSRKIEMSRPIVDRRYPNPDSMFDGRAYPKGAWVLHMLRTQLGDGVFWKGMRTYGNENRYKSVETSDFRKVMERVSGRDLERFFYDWTERPGHPVLNVTSTYLPDTKQVRVEVKQTHPGEAFHFPLPLTIQELTEGLPTPRRPFNIRDMQAELPEPVGHANATAEVTEKDQVFFFNAGKRPGLIVVDPDLTVFCETTEEKGRDLWLNQLRSAPTAAARLAAAAHFGKSKRANDQEALAAALKAESFWGAQVRIAEALGESGGDICRAALIDGLKHADARVRKACVKALGSYRKDAAATAALKSKLADGDPSVQVEASLLRSYAHLQPPDVVAVVTPYLAKSSRQEEIRGAAVEALAASQDLSVMDTLIEWSRHGKPLFVRVSALDGLAELAKKGNPTDEQRKRIVTAVAAGLENEGLRVRSASVRALRELGQSAAVSLPALEAIAKHDPDGRVQEAASKAVEAIRSNSPAPVELGRLREELDRLKSANAALQERLDRFERKSDKK
ncbi:MAG TPA: M1 family aminopeptidase [Gemmataceae bacterium]|nr:M1 family aminopeptidase [Gemmataceae bacterium]